MRPELQGAGEGFEGGSGESPMWFAHYHGACLERTENAFLSAQMSDSPTRKREKHAGICGAIDMRIAADGTWFYCGSPIWSAPCWTNVGRLYRGRADN